MKRVIYFQVLFLFCGVIQAQVASDYFPEQPGLRWEYKVTPLDSLNNEIESANYFKHNLFFTEANFEGKSSKIVQTKSGPEATIHLQPYLDSLFFHFSGSNEYEYFKLGYIESVLPFLDSLVNSSSFSFVDFFRSLENWYSIYRFAQTINDEYSILQIDTTVVINSETLHLRFEFLGERMEDEILNTPIGNLNCKKFVKKFGISYILILPPPLPPIAIPILLLKDYVWIAKDYWIVQGMVPSTNVDLSILGIDPFFIPGLKTMIDTVVNTATVVDEEVYSPKEITLEQNYPNPFNPTTSIQFAISNRQFVSIKVYDVLGNEVATLVNKEKAAGTYEVQFNVAQNGILSSGVYFYKLRAGKFVEIKKMILIK